MRSWFFFTWIWREIQDRTSRQFLFQVSISSTVDQKTSTPHPQLASTIPGLQRGSLSCHPVITSCAEYCSLRRTSVPLVNTCNPSRSDQCIHRAQYSARTYHTRNRSIHHYRHEDHFRHHHNSPCDNRYHYCTIYF